MYIQEIMILKIRNISRNFARSCAEWIFSMEIEHKYMEMEHARSMGMHHGHAPWHAKWLCKMDMHDGQTSWTSIMYMQH
jgi:hypothetical protein